MDSQQPISSKRISRYARLALGREVVAKKRLYLDMKYWIYCREAESGKAGSPVRAEIWTTLQRLVEAGAVICPMSAVLMDELCKLGSADKRVATARVMDRLSGRVSLQPPEELARIELLHFFAGPAKPGVRVLPRELLVWTPVGLLMGEPQIDPRIVPQTRLQELTVDVLIQMSHITVSQAIQVEDGDVFERVRESADYYDAMTGYVRDAKGEASTFQELLRIEVGDTLKYLKPQIIRAMGDLYAYVHDLDEAPTDFALNDRTFEMIGGTLQAEIAQGKISTEFPRAHIDASIHAAIRYRNATYRMGDDFDHLHAMSALPYCHAFLTDKASGTMLCSKPLQLDKMYGCNVFWNDDDVVSYLKTIG